MMMIRACPSLIIAPVMKDRITTQVLGHAVGLCFRPSFSSADFGEANFKSLRLAGTIYSWVQRAIVIATGEHRPTDPGQLVGSGNDHYIAGGAAFQATHPLAQTRSFAFDPQHRGPSPVDKHLAQIWIAPLTDPQQFRFSSGRPLPGYQPQPGRKLASLVKGGPVADS